MPPDTFIRVLADDIIEEELFGRRDTVVVAVSGGPDSMALLHALLAINQEADFSLTLHIAHLNHLLRGEDSEADAAFVQAAADDFGCPCHIEESDVGAAAIDQGVSVEEAARGERYRFLERVCVRAGARAVAVGHHAEDNAETILHRILRGTGLRGLAGIPQRRPISPGSEVEIVRPLLRRTRREILEFLAGRGIAYREDRTNWSDEATRNCIRNVVMPLVRERVNPQVLDALLRLGEQARWLEEYLRETVERMFETLIISRTDQSLSLNAVSLARKSRIVQTELVRRAIACFEIGQQDLSFAHVKAVLELIADPASGKQVHLPAGMSVAKRYDRLIFSLPTEEPRERIAPEVAVHLPGTTYLPVRQMRIDCRIEKVTAEELEQWRGQPHTNEEWADFDKVHPPLTVRARRSGDRFWPLGAPGTKKISEFLTDTKVEPAERQRVAVLCDQLGPVWIVGHRLDERVKLTRQTRNVLKLRAENLDTKNPEAGD